MYILHSFWNQIPQHLTEITVNVLSKIWIEFYILGKDSHSRGKENHIWHCIRKYSTVDKSTSRKNSSKSQQQVANLIIVETEVFKGGSLKNLPKQNYYWPFLLNRQLDVSTHHSVLQRKMKFHLDRIGPWKIISENCGQPIERYRHFQLKSFPRKDEERRLKHCFKNIDMCIRKLCRLKA